MTFRIMAAFAAILAVGAVSASLLGDLCYEACLPTEQQEQQCRAGCSPTGKDDGSVTTSCVEQCVGIGAPCRIYCGENFQSCKAPCEEAKVSERYNCLVTCVQQGFAQNQTSTAI